MSNKYVNLNFPYSLYVNTISTTIANRQKIKPIYKCCLFFVFISNTILPTKESNFIWVRQRIALAGMETPECCILVENEDEDEITLTYQSIIIVQYM